MATQTSMSSDDIIEAIGNLSVVELAELIQKFKDKFGVTIAAPAAPAPAAGGGGAAGGAAPVGGPQGFAGLLKRDGGKGGGEGCGGSRGRARGGGERVKKKKWRGECGEAVTERERM